MGQFLKKIGIYATFLVLFFPLTALLYTLSGSADDFDKMEVEDLVAKYHYLKQNEEKYNTVFIGSSTVFRHINTRTFDSICHTYSFNLGSGGFMPVRSFAFLEAMSLESWDMDYIFFELNAFATLKSNFNTSPSLYALDFNYYEMVMQSIINSGYTKERKLKYIYIYTQTLLYKYFGTGVLGQMVSEKPGSGTNRFAPILENDGYYSFDQDIRENQNELNEGNVIRHNKFRKNKKVLGRLAKKNIFHEPSNFDPPVTRYATFLNELSDRFAEQGVNLVLFIKPRNFNEDDIDFFHQVAHHITRSPVIDLSDPAEYPEFYEFDNSFDISHFNAKGAHIFTAQLANKAKRMGIIQKVELSGATY